MIDLKKQVKRNPFLLAPMDNVTDICFRELCEKYGASYSTTELISVEALIRDKVPKYRYERGNLKINAVQLFGSNPESFALAIDKIKDEADIIDVNFGCPSSSVMSNDSGASLLKDPKNVYEIISALVENTNIPITAKIRLGYKKSSYLEIAKEIERAGAKLITVHGRTASQRYSGEANWDAIKEVYESLNIIVVGNGDIRDEEQITKYLESHCDALMIGRAAIGDPNIFTRFNHYYKTGKKLEFDKKEIQKKTFEEYLEKVDKINFYKKDFKIKQQSMWFTKGVKGSKELRNEICSTKEVNEIIEKVRKF
ncbi:MAG: tRNA-dihydrouridine synthase family protein [Candidatus Woesearchaeota archaeon]|jgi:tRNA-dihydrouridine synthase B|nr:tRNA-dihydrouridine synthase family protein [Candidatus Woesearchaeota archaeon]